ncbi:MAG: iron-sulfur cluster assembly accessory protein [Candidatus Eisenbacteria bacterium]|uniref:Iron-sulfur cluster assembly accessory protein n=1 Tax=Eiseniibacteriota bacterium TaxID=2212470 RepID=A0A933W272_UNCEI|nr:iron-sulfur cluster assembly accessory protein [Candidatus Eisenbacteria bacterium]
MLNVTEAATKKLAELLSQQEGVLGLRLSAIPGGCSGYQYGMAFAEQTVEGDWIGEFNGVKVFVDADSATVLNGVQVDYVETLQATGFTIHNPNAVRSCGCGKSFETEAAEAEAAAAKQQGGGGCGCGSGGCGSH